MTKTKATALVVSVTLLLLSAIMLDGGSSILTAVAVGIIGGAVGLTATRNLQEKKR